MTKDAKTDSEPLDLVQGTLDLLILRTLALEPMHGWGIGRRIEQVSGVFQIKLGSLYPALQRLEGRALIEASWQKSENNRRARYYRLTRAGRHQLDNEMSDWQRLSAGIARVLEAT
ncbi:MAG: PadR family transcriptional regulator [Thermoanaerobaculia bacterium]